MWHHVKLDLGKRVSRECSSGQSRAPPMDYDFIAMGGMVADMLSVAVDRERAGPLPNLVSTFDPRHSIA